jgi:hypothetical protein
MPLCCQQHLYRLTCKFRLCGRPHHYSTNGFIFWSGQRKFDGDIRNHDALLRAELRTQFNVLWAGPRRTIARS